MKKFLKLSLILMAFTLLTACNDKPETPGGGPGENEVTYPGLKKEDNSGYTNSFDVYYNKANNAFCFYDDISRCGTNKITIKTESADPHKYYEYEKKYVFYKDNDKIKVYNDETKNSYVVNIPTTYIGYDFRVDEITKDFVGILYFENLDSFQSYYSVELDKVLYDKKYSELYFLSKDYLSGFDAKCKEQNAYCQQTGVNLLSTKEEKVLLSYKLSIDSNGYYEERKNYGLLRNEKATYIYLETFVDASIYEAIYNDKYEVIANKSDEFSANVGSDGNLYINTKGVLTAYDKDGNKLKSSNKYDIVQVAGEYAIVLNNNKILLVDVDNNQFEVSGYEKKYQQYNVYFSGLYHTTSKDGIYIVVKDSRVKADDIWNNCAENNICNEITKKELSEYDFGYEFKVDPKTKEVKKSPIAIGYTSY